MDRAREPSHHRVEDKDPRDPVRLLALSVIAEAVQDWRGCARGRLKQAWLGSSSWGMSEDRMSREVRVTRWELERWFRDPQGLDFWAGVADLDPQQVRQAVGA